MSHVFVNIPIVAKRIGQIDVVITGRTQVAKDTEVFSINIEVCSICRIVCGIFAIVNVTYLN